MDHLRRLGSSIRVAIPKDEHGFTGRECPELDCEGYFKIEFGTGLKGQGLPCRCPYCGHIASHDSFWTKAQIEYAQSIAKRKILDAVHNDLKSLEFDYRSRGGFGIGISMKVKSGPRAPIRYYRESKLETEVVCVNCTLRYSIYGLFAFCPDCGQHNSRQILGKNLEVVEKTLNLAAAVDKELGAKLIENALEDCISAFDGFGRELCRVYKENAAKSARIGKISFQNLEGARSTILGLFQIDLSAHLTMDEWQAAVRGFQKRHVVAHKMGVVDHEYVMKASDTQAVVGRRITIRANEVSGLAQIIRKLAQGLSNDLEGVRKATRCP